jgi:UDP-N-acetylmuramoyl-tripeptide--D-alanyl-D-alanine ligase
MKSWTPQQIAHAAGARLLSPPLSAAGPERVVVDSRDAGPGTLFVGLEGAKVDGGRFAAQALAQGAWGTLTTGVHANDARCAPPGALLATEDPLRSLQALATAWRGELKAHVIGVTGSTGKTSTKDLLMAVLTPHRRTVASRANFNTEIGLPLEILSAPAETEVLVLEMGMRGAGQIAELAVIAEPDVGVIVSVGPVHLELLGTVEAIAAAKAELIDALPSHGTAVIPAGEPLLEPHLRDDIQTLRFGDGGEVKLVRSDERRVEIEIAGTTIELEVSFTQAHLRRNLLAAVAAASAIGVTPSGSVNATFSPGRGQRTRLANEITLIDDCYNANPMSMRAALDDLAHGVNGSSAGRRVAVLGDMLELGADERRFHEEIGAYATAVQVDLLITVGPLAAAMGAHYAGELHATQDAAEAARTTTSLLEPGDTVLVKGSRGVGLELVCQALTASAGAPA